MHIQRQKALSQTRQYLYDRLKSLDASGSYHLSTSLTQQIQALSAYRYTAAAKGDMNDFLVLLKDADVVDMDYGVNGCAIWLPHGVKYKNRFVSLMSQDLVDSGYDEYVFPNLISPSDFAVLCDEIYNFDKQALKVSAHDLSAVLAPTGESAIYPTVARWLQEGRQLPLRIFQSGPYFRYKSSPNAYIRPIECSFMLEAHGIFASKDDMNDEYERALEVCERWARLLCLDAFVVSRPIAFNKPVSVKTVGYDVLLPNGKTIQAVMAYLQSQIFSKPYGVKFRDKGTKKATEQVTFGITERSIYTALFVHVDELGLRLQSAMAPEQLWIVCRDETELSRTTAEKIQQKLIAEGVRASILPAHQKEGNPFSFMARKGTPLQLIVDDAAINEGIVELFDRRSLSITPLKLTSNLSKSIKSILLEGDDVLRQEQSSKRAEATEALTPENAAQLQAAVAVQKRCLRVVVHDDNTCIDQLQRLGLGEYIGTDQSSEPLVGQSCYSCDKECSTFGYLTKRL